MVKGAERTGRAGKGCAMRVAVSCRDGALSPMEHAFYHNARNFLLEAETKQQPKSFFSIRARLKVWEAPAFKKSSSASHCSG